MKKVAFPYMPSLIITFLLFTPVLTELAPFLHCTEDSPNYTSNSTFETNLKLLRQTLPSKAAPTRFYNTFYGDSPQKVYGEALCRGDVVNSTACYNCIQNGTRQLLKECKTMDAIIWFEFCQVRYSFQYFLKQNIYTGRSPFWNDQEKNEPANPGHFNELLTFLLNNLSREAAFNPSKYMFATGEIKFLQNGTIYGLVQCTPDISGNDCHICLMSALGDLQGCCFSKEGGTMLSRNCNIKFETNRFYNASSNLVTYINPKGRKWKSWKIALVASLTAVVVVILVGSCVKFCMQTRRGNDQERSEEALLQEMASPAGVRITEEGNLASSEELPFMDLNITRAATDDFSDSNKLGQGAFGAVYKGVLPDGKEIAVKRLSRKSWQGLDEFKNEILVIAKLQHRNLVKLLGCGIEGEEKLLIYEFMPNRSLDFFIFDAEMRKNLDWNACYNIISGIAKGILYLHEDSRLKIIHRDLKPSNVLLDHEMVAKISDFGMARIFGEQQNTAKTKRVVGTFGYMAPEYAMTGLFSVKSDVFSFGVLLLEIISGKRNSGFYLTERTQTLLSYAWQLWNEGNQLELVDPTVVGTGILPEVLRCMHIGLLCVQEDPADRPTMSSVVLMLESNPMPLPEPKQPAFAVGRMVQNDSPSPSDPSANYMGFSSMLLPR